MKLIQELIGMHPIVEARREGDLADLIEKYCDQEKFYHFEGPRGVRNFTTLVGILGYRDLDSFLEDNSGAIETMIEWMGTLSNTDWVEEIKAHLHEADEDEDEGK